MKKEKPKKIKLLLVDDHPIVLDGIKSHLCAQPDFEVVGDAANGQEALRKAKVEGVVTLVFVLDETGRVEDPRVENSTRPEFEKPALDAIRKWRFSPGQKDGQAVRTYIRVPLRFRVTTG